MQALLWTDTEFVLGSSLDSGVATVMLMFASGCPSVFFRVLMISSLRVSEGSSYTQRQCKGVSEARVSLSMLSTPCP